jgi:hypothetical protein
MARPLRIEYEGACSKTIIGSDEFVNNMLKNVDEKKSLL